jgi:hypothetical protein
MRSFTLIICGLAATTLSAELPQNALCGDSVDCSNRCNGGRYHIVNDQTNDSTYFGCSREGVRNYRVFNCQSPKDNYKTRNATATQLACDAAAGRQCQQCVISYSQVKAFSDSCLAQGTSNEAYSYGTLKDVPFDVASQLASCK